MNKKQNALNFSISLFSQIIIIILGLIIPRIILTHYGSDLNGLTGTITQVYTYVALLEAGIGQATRNSLYKPLITNDKKQINKVLSSSRHYYRKITLFYILAVCCLSIILPLVVKSSLGYWTIFAIAGIEGIIGVISFFFVQNWTCLLISDGKNYIVSSIELLSKILIYAVKIILALNKVDFVFIELCSLIVSLIKTLCYSIYCKKNYSWVAFSKNEKIEKLPDRNYYVINEIAWAIFSSTDMIVLSIFCSTNVSSVYSIYSLIYTSISTLLNAIYSSLVFNLGQMFEKDKAKYIKIHDLFNSFFIGTITILLCTTYWLTIPFIKLYTEGITDVNYIQPWLPLLFSIIQLLSWSRYVAGNLTGIAGYAKQAAIASTIEAIINVSLSLILVNFYGIYGVTIATIIALPFKVIYLNWLADKRILKRKPFRTLLIFGVNYAVFLITVIVNHFFSIDSLDSYYQFILYGILILLIYILIILAINIIANFECLHSLKLVNFKKNKKP